MESKYTKYLFIVALSIIILLSFLIIKPLINVFLWSLILSYLFYPTYTYIHKRLKRPSLSSAITILVMILVVTVPFVMIVRGISQEAFAFYKNAKEQTESGGISVASLTSHCKTNPSPICDSILFMDNSVRTLLPQELMDQAGQRILEGILAIAISFILNLPAMLFNIAIAFFITFFLIRDWEKFRKSVHDYLPFKSADMDKILTRINTTTHSILFASIMVALIQGVLSMIGYWVVGLPSPIILGALTGFFGLLPVLGTAVIWVPAALFLIGKGVLFDTQLYMYQGVGLLLYGALVISLLDNFLRPKLAGDSAKIHPVVIITGVIGGTKLMGFIGIFVGPVILSLLITFVTLAIEKYHVEHIPPAQLKGVDPKKS
ncbi:MAG TPA: AI-2E family transporter [Candidatus Nanoarchaeia archaeon]|nr:AI-2E family transporter [Candidatus Nanoarchaeia archaeon]